MCAKRVLILLAALAGVAWCDQGPSDYGLLDGVRNGTAPDLRLGMQGPQITALQNALAGSCHPVNLTAVFDDATLLAVRTFQKQFDLPADGIVGPHTMSAFDIELGIGASVSAGLRRITQAEVTSDITTHALEILHANGSNPIGSEYPFLSPPHAYVGRVELHFHPFGGPMKPWGYHHGISIFINTTTTTLTSSSSISTPSPAKKSALSLSGLPPRVGSMMTGSEFMVATANVSESVREQMMFDELSHGNVPEFLRTYVETTITTVYPTHTVNITIFVLPDYMSIGSDKDYVRVPLWAPTIQTLCDLWNASVPTPAMVDLIWQAADVHVAPFPLPPTNNMRTNAWIEREQVATQREVVAIVGDSFPTLLGGNKKDVVISNRLIEHPDRVAIYGWHQLNGQPIQPLTIVHGAHYADYSHGMRVVAQEVIVDGVVMRLDEVLQSAELASILSNEGVMPKPRYPLP